MKILVTCPPMLGIIDRFRPIFSKHNIKLSTPEVIQTLSEKELTRLVPQHDGWIIGDDPATRKVFTAGKNGNLKAAVKWGIGVDNIDFAACKELAIPITNTPNMFGNEVADIAMSYVTALARETFEIDREIRLGDWPKPCGISLSEKTVALIGFGDIGKATAKRLLAAEMKVIVYDPAAHQPSDIKVINSPWPKGIDKADFIVITCSLTDSSKHMINADLLKLTKFGVRIINVGRGPIICEPDLIDALSSGQVYSVALDVFENEPLPTESPLRDHPHSVLGSHNSSNTIDAVERTSHIAIQKLLGFLKVSL